MDYTTFTDSGQAIQAIKETVDLAELVSRDESLNNNFGSHSSKHASKNGKCLHVTPEKQLWRCFSCGEGGDIFSWVMDRDGCGFPEAVDWICQTYNLPHPTLNHDQWEQQKMARQEADLIRPIIKQSMEWYHSQLKPLPHLLYFGHRGIEQETVDQLLIGYAPDKKDGLYKHLRQNTLIPMISFSKLACSTAMTASRLTAIGTAISFRIGKRERSCFLSAVALKMLIRPRNILST